MTPDAGRGDVPLSRAERRRALEDEAAPAGTAPSGPGAVAAGAAAAGAAGAATWASRDEEDSSPESERIASAADYRDEVPAGDADAGSSTDVYQPVATGIGAGMSRDSRQGDDTADLAKDTESPSGEWGGPRTDADAAAAAETSATAMAVQTTRARTEPRPMAGQTTRARTEPRPMRGADDAGADGTATDGGADDAGADGTAGLAIVSDTDAYAATEPVPAAEQTPPIERVAPASADTDEHPLSSDDHDRTTDEEAAADLDETRDRVSSLGVRGRRGRRGRRRTPRGRGRGRHAHRVGHRRLRLDRAAAGVRGRAGARPGGGRRRPRWRHRLRCRPHRGRGRPHRGR